MPSKKQVLKESIKKTKPALTKEERQDLGRELLKPKSSSIKRALFSLEIEDLKWLTETVSTINLTVKRKTNKSELMRLGLAQLKKLKIEEIKKLLKSLT